MTKILKIAGRNIMVRKDGDALDYFFRGKQGYSFRRATAHSGDRVSREWLVAWLGIDTTALEGAEEELMAA